MIYKEFLGHKVSQLGFGAMRLPQIGTEWGSPLNKEEAIALIRKAYESGVNYFDTAYVYGGGQSEVILGEALSIYPRDSYYVATKFPGLHPPQGGWTMEKVKETFEEQLRHLYSDPNVPLADYFHELKKTGKIRHFGFSSHSKPDLLEKIIEWKDYFEFCQIQLNYLDWTMQDAKQQYEILEKAGLPVIVMEPVRGGRLANPDEKCTEILKNAHPDWSPASWALRFAGALDNVKVVLSGMSNMEQLDDNLGTFAEGELLSESDRELLLNQIVPLMADMVPCTGCRYCMAECPMNLKIPNLISLYNEMNFSPRTFYLNGLKEEDMPSNCIACGACTTVCPQSIDIPDVLQKLDVKIKEVKK